MTKLLIILLVSGALANGLARTHEDPPLLIDPAPSSLDAGR
ncbi:hypothetical protein [Sphingomonas limnosediminicola]